MYPPPSSESDLAYLIEVETKIPIDRPPNNAQPNRFVPRVIQLRTQQNRARHYDPSSSSSMMIDSIPKRESEPSPQHQTNTEPSTATSFAQSTTVKMENTEPQAQTQKYTAPVSPASLPMDFLPVQDSVNSPDQRFFTAPLEGLVSNKPFSLELHGRLTHITTRQSRNLIFPLAVKVSARHMEKRSNTYTAIPHVYSSSVPTVKIIKPDSPQVKVVRPPSDCVEGTPAAAVGMKPPGSTPTSARRCLSFGGMSSHPFGQSSVFSRSTRTCPSAELKNATRTIRTAFDQAKDRSIGMKPVQLLIPQIPPIPSHLSPSSTLDYLCESLYICYTPYSQFGRMGFLESVVTRGGGSSSRPSQHYILLQSGFGYIVHLPQAHQIPLGITLEISALHLRSWEWEVAPIKLLKSADLLVTYPIPPLRRRTALVSGSGCNGSSSSFLSKNPHSRGMKRKRQTLPRPGPDDDSTDSEADDDGNQADEEGSVNIATAGNVTMDTMDTMDDDMPLSQLIVNQESVMTAAVVATNVSSFSTTIKCDRPLRLPTRHGRSLSALLSASQTISPLRSGLPIPNRKTRKKKQQIQQKLTGEVREMEMKSNVSRDLFSSPTELHLGLSTPGIYLTPSPNPFPSERPYLALPVSSSMNASTVAQALVPSIKKTRRGSRKKKVQDNADVPPGVKLPVTGPKARRPKKQSKLVDASPTVEGVAYMADSYRPIIHSPPPFNFPPTQTQYDSTTSMMDLSSSMRVATTLSPTQFQSFHNTIPTGIYSNNYLDTSSPPPAFGSMTTHFLHSPEVPRQDHEHTGNLQLREADSLLILTPTQNATEIEQPVTPPSPPSHSVV